MGYKNNVYAQNWIEQLRTNHERLHPERGVEERRERVDRRGVDVFGWWHTDEGDAIWRQRYGKLEPNIFELIR